MLGFQAAPRLFSGQADKQFCLCSSEYEMSTCVIYCTNQCKAEKRPFQRHLNQHDWIDGA